MKANERYVPFLAICKEAVIKVSLSSENGVRLILLQKVTN